MIGSKTAEATHHADAAIPPWHKITCKAGPGPNGRTKGRLGFAFGIRFQESTLFASLTAFFEDSGILRHFRRHPYFQGGTDTQLSPVTGS